MTRASRAALAAALVAACLLPRVAAARDELEIAVQHGYGTSRAFTVEGRVAERRTSREARADDSRLRNFWRRLRLLFADEEKGAALRATFAGATFAARTDGEGYFTIGGATPRDAAPGWNVLRIETADGAARTDAEILIVPAENTLGIISDVDDTVVVSEVPDRSRLLQHTLLENYLQRRPAAGVAELYRAVAARNPRPAETAVVYLTASPRQLVPAIRAFLEHNGFPRGPIVAKLVSDGKSDPLFDQEKYKTERIERILADLAPVRFVLSGDDGERDPEVYRAIRERHPDRVEAVWIRRVSPDPARPVYPGQETTPGAR